ncbi:MAG: hypothetical protein OEU76_03495 [Cyclobacteriaceae bacterium]|nr:hypothetical protein [Cyclobacteriaceae bacterium]
MKVTALTLLVVLSIQLYGQKKLTPATRSELTGINLPKASQQDKRLLSITAAMLLLEEESKNDGTKIKYAEVFVLPPEKLSYYTADSLTAQLRQKEWQLSAVVTDPKYIWLQKGNRYIMAYFSSEPNNSSLYFGEPENIPVLRTNQNRVTPATVNSVPAAPSSSNPATELSGNQKTTASVGNTVSKGDATFTFTNTNFDDGWSSTIQADWVLVSKGKTNVFLWYALPYNASDFSGTGLVERDYYWDHHVTRFYNIQTKQYQDDGEFISSLKPNYVEGWAVDKRTGERKFIAMVLSISPNIAVITLAATSDEATFRQQFPKANDKYVSDLVAMKRYNQFAIAKSDILGTWTESDGAAVNYYNAYTGSYAGMGVATTSGQFIFNPDGTYSSIHNGATGMVGSMNTFQQEFKGNYQVSNWELTLDKRFNGKTEIYFGYFEAVRGGRVLQLNDKKYSGTWYHLIKQK